jgi:hypothetical protein
VHPPRSRLADRMIAPLPALHAATASSQNPIVLQYAAPATHDVARPPINSPAGSHDRETGSQASVCGDCMLATKRPESIEP